MSEPCKCGHPKSAHIYDEGACRPGFFCCVQCEKYVPSATVGDYRVVIATQDTKIAELMAQIATKDRILAHRATKIDELLELVRIAGNLHLGNPLPEFSKRREEFESGWAEIDGMTAKALGACPPHAWSRDGETCTKCGDKDWM